MKTKEQSVSSIKNELIDGEEYLIRINNPKSIKHGRHGVGIYYKELGCFNLNPIIGISEIDLCVEINSKLHTGKQAISPYNLAHIEIADCCGCFTVLDEDGIIRCNECNESLHEAILKLNFELEKKPTPAGLCKCSIPDKAILPNDWESEFRKWLKIKWCPTHDQMINWLKSQLK